MRHGYGVSQRAVLDQKGFVKCPRCNGFDLPLLLQVFIKRRVADLGLLRNAQQNHIFAGSVTRKSEFTARKGGLGGQAQSLNQGPRWFEREAQGLVIQPMRHRPVDSPGVKPQGGEFCRLGDEFSNPNMAQKLLMAGEMLRIWAAQQPQQNFIHQGLVRV